MPSVLVTPTGTSIARFSSGVLLGRDFWSRDTQGSPGGGEEEGGRGQCEVSEAEGGGGVGF